MDPYGPIHDDGLDTTVIQKITAYGTKIMSVVYTNEVKTMNHHLEKFEQWLDREPANYRFVGLDLEYTRERYEEDPPQKMALIQIAYGRDVLVFHYCRSKEHCPKLVEFLQSKNITFASVDIRRDRAMLQLEDIIIPAELHIDIQDMFKSQEKFERIPPFDRDGLGYLAEKIIDGSCWNLKEDFPHNGHHYWEQKPISALHLEYAARDAYYSYEMYRRLLIVKEGLFRGTRKAEIVAAQAAEEQAAAAQAAAAEAEEDEAAAVGDEDEDAAADEDVQAASPEADQAADGMAVEDAEPPAKRPRGPLDEDDDAGWKKNDDDEHIVCTGWDV